MHSHLNGFAFSEQIKEKLLIDNVSPPSSTGPGQQKKEISFLNFVVSSFEVKRKKTILNFYFFSSRLGLSKKI